MGRTGVDVVVLDDEEHDEAHGGDVERVQPAHPLLQPRQPGMVTLQQQQQHQQHHHPDREQQISGGALVCSCPRRWGERHDELYRGHAGVP